MIRIGTSGFSFKDWVGTVYPDGFNLKDALVYYQDKLGFDCVEINSTYYTLIPDRVAAGWANKTAENFEFLVKAYRGVTHDPFDARLGPEKPGVEKAYEDIERSVFSLQPLVKSKKLGAVLLQFPIFFVPGNESTDYMLECRKRFKGIPLVVEFRNKGWAKPETFEFLKKNGLGYCAVDEPKLPRLMPFVNEVTSDVGYLRFHGRNNNWFNAPMEVRYDYLYSEDELKEFVPEIKKMEKNSKNLYILFNNCHAGKAVKDAKKLKGMLGL